MNSYYIDNTNGSNSNNGKSEQAPFKTPAAIAGSNFLSPGDIVYFKRGETWTGVDANFSIKSAGTANFPIILTSYGQGNKPRFVGSDIYAGSWTLDSGNIWYATGQTQSFCWLVGQGNDVLYRRTTKAGMSAGTYFFDSSADRVYVWLRDSSNPNSNTMRIGQYPTTQFGILILIGTTSFDASYVELHDLEIRFANGIAFGTGSDHTTFYDCDVIYNGKEAFYFAANGYVAPGAQYAKCIKCTGRYTQSAGNGNGQAFTMETAYSWWIDCISEFNGMAGFDFLDYHASTSVHHSGAIRCTANQNGQSALTGVFDSGFYIDGAHDVLLYGCLSHNAGTGRTSEAQSGIGVSNEHPTLKTAENIYLVDCMAYGNSSSAFNLNPQAGFYVDNVQMINCTLQNGLYFRAMEWRGADLPVGAKGFTLKNNVIYCTGASSGTHFLANTLASNIHTNNNNYYNSGGSNVLRRNNVDYTLTTWKTANPSLDLASVQGNPLLVSATSSTFDARLQRIAEGYGANSPSLVIADKLAYSSLPGWVTSIINSQITGTTRIDNSSDGPTNYDLGFHYLSKIASEISGLTVEGVKLEGVTIS